MKANKALKRLAKVESLISSVTKRLATGAPHLRKALDDLNIAFGHAKEAVSAHLSSDTPKKKAAPKSGPKGKKGTRTAKKGADKKAAKKAKAKAPVAKARKKRASKIVAKTPVPSPKLVPEVAQEFSAGAPDLSD